MGVCSAWIDQDDVDACCSADVAPGALLTSSMLIASNVMWRLSGRRWPGACTKTIRPCAVSCGCGFVYTLATDGSWWRGTGCGCGCAPPQVDLRRSGDVVSITSVTIDGVVLDASKHRLDEGRWLVRVENADGTNDGWPTVQNLARPTTAEDTWKIVYVYGSLPDADGIAAAASLACELYKLCSGDDCALSSNVRNANAEGISLEFVVVNEALKEGKLGVHLADLWLGSVNPKGLARRPSFISPDDHLARHRNV